MHSIKPSDSTISTAPHSGHDVREDYELPIADLVSAILLTSVIPTRYEGSFWAVKGAKKYGCHLSAKLRPQRTQFNEDEA